jgi:curved DNA-binding protein CbpA
MNLYDELELPTYCTFDEIKQKYRILAQTHHPDKGGDEEKFKRIKQAYEILSDPVKRSEYDSTGKYQQGVSIRDEAIQRLSNMISHHTQNINPELDDLILKMKVDIYDTEKNVRNEIIICESHIRKYTAIAERIKLKQEGENILKSFVEHKVQEIKNQILSLHKTLETFKLMLEILEDYHYSLEDFKLFIEN